MSDKDKKQSNNDELMDVKSLVADADGGDFALDDILAEFGSGKPVGRGAVPVQSRAEEKGPELDLPWPEAPRRPRNRDNVVAFPGGASFQRVSMEIQTAEPVFPARMARPVPSARENSVPSGASGSTEKSSAQRRVEKVGEEMEQPPSSVRAYTAG